ncbi:hypothetical protein EYF80_009850 [Liparis tanakae]|uniref:Uncharacterized protein n=1 Tax=Liparis tanakae TaxID=230148 RepID=A0A4Z2IRJ3_9TELE|nr:hypothetical protein EYF80_009850 [Liparis tanakae]
MRKSRAVWNVRSKITFRTDHTSTSFPKYSITDEAVPRRDLYMSCLGTCGEAAEYIATLTRQKRQAERRNRFLQEELIIKNDRIRRLEGPIQSGASPENITDEELLALPLLEEDLM